MNLHKFHLQGNHPTIKRHLCTFYLEGHSQEELNGIKIDEVFPKNHVNLDAKPDFLQQRHAYSETIWNGNRQLPSQSNLLHPFYKVFREYYPGRQEKNTNYQRPNKNSRICCWVPISVPRRRVFRGTISCTFYSTFLTEMSFSSIESVGKCPRKSLPHFPFRKSRKILFATRLRGCKAEIVYFGTRQF